MPGQKGMADQRSLSSISTFSLQNVSLQSETLHHFISLRNESQQQNIVSCRVLPVPKSVTCLCKWPHCSRWKMPSKLPHIDHRPKHMINILLKSLMIVLAWLCQEPEYEADLEQERFLYVADVWQYTVIYRKTQTTTLFWFQTRRDIFKEKPVDHLEVMYNHCSSWHASKWICHSIGSHQFPTHSSCSNGECWRQQYV